MNKQKEEKLIKQGIDPDLFEMFESRTIKQYHIDIKDLIDTMVAIESKKKHTKRRIRSMNKRKTKVLTKGKKS